jgi:hypothetical protein
VLDSLKRFNAESKFKQAVCALMARDLDPEVQRTFEENFAKLDKNKDGTVTVQELREAIVQMVRLRIKAGFNAHHSPRPRPIDCA